MRKIYISHPFGNKEENKEKVEEYIKEFLEEGKNILYVSPIHATGFLYETVSYKQGIDYCLELLKDCDEIYMCGDWENSKGCCMEYGFAKALGIPIEIIY